MNIAFSGYKIIRELGSGASASVHLAVQENLNRRVAIKVMRNTYSNDASFSLRFKREGRIIAQLSHPNIVPVYDVGENDDHLFMAMEYLPGKDLRAKSKDLKVEQALGYMIDLANALNYAHEKGYVHRDVKPENILFRANGEIVLTDFGIARPTESLTHMTVTGVLMGTPSYMSPEQIDGRELDGRSDLYALGAIFFELLTGKVPYQSDSIVNVGLQHLTADIPKLPKTTNIFQNLINLLLAKNPGDRPVSGKKLVDVLEAKLRSVDRTLLETNLSVLWPESPDNKIYMSEYLQAPKKSARLKKNLSFALVTAVIFGLGFYQYQLINPHDPMDTGIVQENIPAINANDTKQQLPAVAAWEAELSRANRLRDEGVIWTKEGDNALLLYRKVLEMDPENLIASNGEMLILTDFSSQVESAIYATDYQGAEARIDMIAELWPNSDRATVLKEKLKTAMDLAASEAQRREALDKQQRINSLLSKGRQAVLAKQYVEPADQSALAYYQQIIAIDPQNELVAQEILSLQNTLLADARRFADSNDFNQAFDMIRQLSSFAPESEEITNVRGFVKSRKTQFEEELTAQELQLALNNKIQLLNNKTYQWQLSELKKGQLVKEGESLLAEIKLLEQQAPENTQLLTLRQNIQSRLTQLDEEKPETKRFKVSGF